MKITTVPDPEFADDPAHAADPPAIYTFEGVTSGETFIISLALGLASQVSPMPDFSIVLGRLHDAMIEDVASKEAEGLDAILDGILEAGE